MKTNTKRILSVVMTICMLIAMIPIQTLASDVPEEDVVTFIEADEAGETSDQNDTTGSEGSSDEGSSDEEVFIAEEPAQEPADQATSTESGEDSGDDSTDFSLFSSGAEDEDLGISDGEIATFSSGSEDETSVTVEALQSARDTSGDDFYKIVHVDAGRKYFSPENIKKIIDNAAAAGFNQVEIYLSDNQGFRFALDDMNITTSTGNTYDLSSALGDGYSDGSKYPDGSGNYLTQSEMTDIISYASDKGIDIVPCINVPGHMGAILEEFPDFRYSGSKSSIDLENTEAVAFALAITEKYAAYFENQGVKFYNLGADEYANDMSTMGFQGLYTSGKYQKFVDFLNNAAQIVINHGMTPRAFNDGIYYNEDNAYSINSAIQVCYWSSGWSGYNLASAQYLVNQGMKVINTHGDYYWVLGNSSWQCSADKASQFNYTSFQYRTGTTGNGTISDPAGAMFCIWCDVGNANGTDGGTAVVSATADVIAAFGVALPATEPPETPDPDSSTEYSEDEIVSVTAPGLTSLNCTKVDGITIEGADNVLAYEMIPMKGEEPYTGEANVSIKVPDGWNTANMGAFVVEADNTVKKITGEYDKANGVYTYQAPHFSVGGIYDVAPTEVEVTENKTITVTVGHTATATISGANYAGTYTTEDPSIATVEVTGTDATEATTTYTEASVTCNTLISWDKSNWTAVSGYYYKTDDGNYYPVYAKRSWSLSWSGISYTYTWGYSTTSSTSNVTRIGTQSTTNTSTTPNITVYTKSDTAGTPASTTVTFTGVAVGTTYVTVGNTRYTINVVAEDLSKVTPLTVEFWITNQPVQANGADSMEIKAADPNIYSESGVDISTLVPENGTQSGNPMVFWKGTRLASDNMQTTGGGVDKTKSGNDFTYIRYWDGNWAYSVDGKEWTMIVVGDQIVAYYLQKTEVTDEITTLVSDYGNVPGNDFSLSPFVMVDYAVKYESGELNPDSFPTNKTIAFHCNSESLVDLGNTVIQDGNTYYRKLGTIKAVETADYEVYMITLTPTSDTKTDIVANNAIYVNNYLYQGTEKVVWVDDEANLGDFADEALHYTSPSGDIKYSVGGEPNITGLEIYKNQCMLVTYYVRAKVTEDSLSVHYIDQTANQEFYSYNIAVKSGTFFNENIGLADPWKGDLANGSVTNLQDKIQTVSANLSTMPAIGAQYRYSVYECKSVQRSGDGKDVYLYYTFNNDHSFVVDFGLPLNITIANLGIGGTWTSASVSGAQYGTATATVGGGVTYTPTKILQGIETLQLTLSNSTESVTHQIYIYPATTVYYEEGFATLTGFTGGSKGTGPQSTEAVGSETNNNYGYDPTYSSPVGPSNGSESTSTTYGDKAEFTFTGTGVGIYANCTDSTGALMIRVRDTETKELVQVKTALLGGITGATNMPENTIGYNVPVAVFKDLALGTYTVTITNIKSSSIDPAGGMMVKLDGFRIYGTLGSSHSVYSENGEANPNFVELRDAVLGESKVSEITDSKYANQVVSAVMKQVYDANGNTSGAIVIDSASMLRGDQLKDVLDNGPKNELYLWPGQSVVFKLNADSAQIGLKALNAQVAYKINNGTETIINTSTDMFYPLNEKNVTITNTSANGGILSITEIKTFGNAGIKSAFASLTENDLLPALMSLGFKEEPSTEPEPVYADATLNITVYDPEGSELASDSITAYGIVGETNTFFANDINAAVSEMVPEGYELKNVTYSDVSVVYGETASVSFEAEKKVIEPTATPSPSPSPTPTPVIDQPDKSDSFIGWFVDSLKNFFNSIFNRH